MNKVDLNKWAASLLALAYATAPKEFEDMDFTPKNKPAVLPASGLSQLPPDVLGGLLTEAAHDVNEPTSFIQFARLEGLPIPDALRDIAEEFGLTEV